MRNALAGMAISAIVLAACSPSGLAPKAVETMRTLGFADVAYVKATETKEGVVLHDVTGKDVGGRPFRATSLSVARRGKDSAWSSLTIEGYADGEASARTIRFGDLAWTEGAASSEVLIMGASLKTPRATYSADQITLAPKSSGTHVHAVGARLTMPGVTAMPLSQPMTIDVQANTAAGGVFRVDYFSVDSPAWAGKGTLTFAAPGLPSLGWNGARTLLGLDWVQRATLLDLDGVLDVRQPIPALATPDAETGPDRQGQGLRHEIRSTGEPIQAQAFGEAWRAALAGLPSSLSVSSGVPRLK